MKEQRGTKNDDLIEHVPSKPFQIVTIYKSWNKMYHVFVLYLFKHS